MSEPDKFKAMSAEKQNILILVTRLIYEVERNIRGQLSSYKGGGEIFNVSDDEHLDFLRHTFIHRINDCINGIKNIDDELLSEITKMQLKTIIWLVEEVESYKRKAKLEKAHQAGEKAVLTATGTILRLVPTERHD
jgi:hypothetical protein